MDSDYLSQRSAVQYNSRLLQAMEAGKVPLLEFFDNVLEHTVRCDERTWNDSIAVVPAHLRPQFLDYARSYLIPVDFMPSPGVILPPPKSEDEIQAVKEERRPRYMRLFQVIEQVCTANESSGGQHPSAS